MIPFLKDTISRFIKSILCSVRLSHGSPFPGRSGKPVRQGPVPVGQLLYRIRSNVHEGRQGFWISDTHDGGCNKYLQSPVSALSNGGRDTRQGKGKNAVENI